MYAPIATAISGTATSRMVRMCLRENFFPRAFAASGLYLALSAVQFVVARALRSVFSLPRMRER